MTVESQGSLAMTRMQSWMTNKIPDCSRHRSREKTKANHIVPTLAITFLSYTLISSTGWLWMNPRGNVQKYTSSMHRSYLTWA